MEAPNLNACDTEGLCVVLAHVYDTDQGRSHGGGFRGLKPLP